MAHRCSDNDWKPGADAHHVHRHGVSWASRRGCSRGFDDGGHVLFRVHHHGDGLGHWHSDNYSPTFRCEGIQSNRQHLPAWGCVDTHFRTAFVHDNEDFLKLAARFHHRIGQHLCWCDGIHQRAAVRHRLRVLQLPVSGFVHRAFRHESHHIFHDNHGHRQHHP